MNNLKISFIQSDLQWENKTANLKSFSEKIEKVPNDTDLIILPEMFTTGFSMNAAFLAETMEGETVNWMKNNAKQKNCAITGSFICEENGKYYNRLVWMNADGTYETYDKRHLFSMGDENNHYTPGNKRLVVTYKGWRICPMICYDLRFPVWSRNTKNNPFDLLIYLANWPDVRMGPWNKLLCARAIENQCYVAAVNRVGNDISDTYYSGHSKVIDPKGEIICESETAKEGIYYQELNYQELESFRLKFPVLNDMD